MFFREMLKKQQNVVEIVDIRREIVVEMLRYVYTGSVQQKPPLECGAYCELLAAADKYQIEPLKLVCEEKLRSLLSVENCIQVLNYAEKHRAPELRMDGVLYANTHMAELVDSEPIKSSTRRPSDYDSTSRSRTARKTRTIDTGARATEQQRYQQQPVIISDDETDWAALRAQLTESIQSLERQIMSRRAARYCYQIVYSHEYLAIMCVSRTKCEMSTCNRISGITSIVKDECSFTWTIADYGLISKRPEVRLNSPVFCVNDCPDKRFRLHYETSPNWVSLYLVRVSPARDELTCECKLAIAVGDTTIAFKEFVKVFASKGHSSDEDEEDWGFTEFTRIEKIERAVAATGNNVVTIRCDVVVAKRLEKNLIVRQKIEPLARYDWIFLDERSSDVNLQFPVQPQQQPVPAHKLVLAGASPVFRAMFFREMLKKQQNVVEIVDIRREIVVEMLRYVYTGSVHQKPPLECGAYCELLAAADKYQIEPLKLVCEEKLRSMLSVENCIQVLNYAEKHRAPELRMDGVLYANTHMAELVDSEPMKQHASPFVLDIIRLKNDDDSTPRSRATRNTGTNCSKSKRAATVSTASTAAPPAARNHERRGAGLDSGTGRVNGIETIFGASNNEQMFRDKEVISRNIIHIRACNTTCIEGKSICDRPGRGYIICRLCITELSHRRPSIKVYSRVQSSLSSLTEKADYIPRRPKLRVDSSPSVRATKATLESPGIIAGRPAIEPGKRSGDFRWIQVLPRTRIFSLLLRWWCRERDYCYIVYTDTKGEKLRGSSSDLLVGRLLLYSRRCRRRRRILCTNFDFSSSYVSLESSSNSSSNGGRHSTGILIIPSKLTTAFASADKNTSNLTTAFASADKNTPSAQHKYCIQFDVTFFPEGARGPATSQSIQLLKTFKSLNF
ncbi:unnamed protein product, partial [Trichogramma brassicae]